MAVSKGKRSKIANFGKKRKEIVRNKKQFRGRGNR